MQRPDIQLLRALRSFLKERFDLSSDKAQDDITIAEMTKGVEFKGTNLWVLIFAIFIASIGLNVNSTAVIIGAMLISPLMGPIMGVGLGAGINDFDLIKKAIRNLSVAVGISVLTSCIYFLITPLDEAQSELLARTYPTLWDVLIALFGGLAGVVAGSRKEKSNTIPGVAIATALMPPLCTAGYGLANGNMAFFFGAFYLFLINSVFISVSTFLIVRFMNFPRKQFDDPQTEKKVKFYVSALVLITIIPSAYLAYNLVRKTLFEEKARVFLAQEFQYAETQIIGNKIDFSSDPPKIEITLYGKKIDQDEIDLLQTQLTNYGIENAKLVLHQGYQDDGSVQQKALEEYSQSMRTQIIEDLYTKNEELVKSKDEKIQLLELELLKLKGNMYPTADISAELRIQYPALNGLAISTTPKFSLKEEKMDTVCLVVASFSKRPASRDIKKISDWMKLRTKNEKLELIIR
jgi:uncharacterized hydrophobic protein (TIGR00271 family)